MEFGWHNIWKEKPDDNRFVVVWYKLKNGRMAYGVGIFGKDGKCYNYDVESSMIIFEDVWGWSYLPECPEKLFY